MALDTSTVTWLMKFVRQQLKQFPITLADSLTVTDLTVVDSLTVKGSVMFAANQNWRYIGTTGNPAFANSWVNFGAPYDGAAFQQGSDGFIQLHGTIKSGTLASTAFTLPPGFRPKFTTPFIVWSNSAAGQVVVGADGTVTASSPSSNTSVALDQIRFKAA